MLHTITEQDIEKQKRLIYAAEQAFETLVAIPKLGAMQLVAQRDLDRLRDAILDIDPEWRPIIIDNPYADKMPKMR